jgi:hypothetical protein
MRYTNPFKLLLPVLLAFVLNAVPAKSQNQLMFAPSALSGWPDTAYVGDTVLVAGQLYNSSASDTFGINDILYLQGTVDTGAAPIPFSVPYPQQVIISPGDTQPVFFAFFFDTSVVGAPQFHVGNNVVVVWPIGVGPGNWQPGDSLTLNVLVLDTMSSVPEPPDEFVRIWPVPANGPLYISSLNGQYQFTYVIIRDALGQTVYSGIPTGQSISTDEWSRGLYTVEAGLSNGTVSWFKIMRQ